MNRMVTVTLVALAGPPARRAAGTTTAQRPRCRRRRPRWRPPRSTPRPPTAPAPTGEPSGAFDPVTIEHAFGSTTFEQRPQRIATLGMQWTDVVLAMGEAPVAHIADPSAGDGDIYPWQAGLLDGSTGLPVTSAQDIPFEQLAALDPDLILVTYLADDQSIYDRLERHRPDDRVAR